MPHAPRLTAAMCAHGRSLGDPRLAPDGGRLAFLAGGGGRARLVVLDAHGGPEVVLTSDPPPVRAGAHGGGVFDWTPDGRALVYAAVDGCLWLQGADGGPPRQISDRGPAFSPAVAPDGSRVAYVVDAHHVAVARLDPGGPWPARLSVGADFCFDPAWSPDGEWVAWHEWDVPAMPWDDSRIVARPATAATGAAGAGEVVTVAGGRGRQPTAVSQPRWSPDGTRLGFLCDAGGWLNLWVAPGHLNGRAHPLLLEPHEHGGPAWGPGQRSWAWSPDGSAVALCRNQDGFGSLQLVDAATGAAHRLATGVHGGLSWAGQRLAAVRSDATTPTEVVCYLGADLGRRRTLAVGPVAGLATGSSPPTLVRWRGEDGGEVPGRLHRPTRPALGDPPPLLAWVHGGPTGQAEAGFDPRLAYWLDRGWAVLVPDHRGSTGHGRAFAQALAGRWGELD
ncbi:MAG: S9 family peptidase, partial [Acidimicrobiales bacterium]